MKEKLRGQLTDFLGGSNDVVEQFLTILNLPDSQFDLIYPNFQNKIETVFSTKQFREEALNNLELMPLEDEREVRDELENFLNDINSDETLSENKKNMLCTIINKTVKEIYDLKRNPRERVKVKIVKIHSDAILPKYAHDTDAGADIFAVEDMVIKPHTTELIKTGLKIAIPSGYEIQLRPRSGLSLKTNLRIANAPATIDSDYRGEIGIIMENTGSTPYTINKGDKIAQMLIAPTPMIVWDEVVELDETERGNSGFGSTDKK